MKRLIECCWLSDAPNVYVEQMRSRQVLPALTWSCDITERLCGTLQQSQRAHVWWMSPTSHSTGNNATLPLAPGPTTAIRCVSARIYVRWSPSLSRIRLLMWLLYMYQSYHESQVSQVICCPKSSIKHLSLSNMASLKLVLLFLESSIDMFSQLKNDQILHRHS